MDSISIFFLGISVVILCFYGFVSWYFVGKDNLRKNTVTELEIPKNISAMKLAYINGEKSLLKISQIGVLSLISKNSILNYEVKSKQRNVKIIGKNIKKEDIYWDKSKERKIKKKLYYEETQLLNFYGKIMKEDYTNAINSYEKIVEIVENIKWEHNTKFYRDNKKYLITMCILMAICTLIVGTVTTLYTNNEIFKVILIFIWIWIFVYLQFAIKLSYLIRIRTAYIIIGAVWGIHFLNAILEEKISDLVVIFGMIVFYGIIFFIYSKIIGKYMGKGLQIKEYTNNLRKFVKSTEGKKGKIFANKKELVIFFKSFFPYAVALKIENETIEILKNSLKLKNYGKSEQEIFDEINIDLYMPKSEVMKKVEKALKKGKKKASIKQGKIHIEAMKKARVRYTKIGGRNSGNSGGFSGGGFGGGGGGSW